MSQTVLVCDDAIFMRTMIGDILRQADYDVIGEAETGLEAVERFKELKPDLVTMDIVMPDMGGIDAVREIVKIDPSARVLMCSAMGQQALGCGGDSGGRQRFCRQAVSTLARTRGSTASSRLAMDAAKYADLFLDESREHLTVINNQLLVLEAQPDSAGSVDAIFRAVHNLKGMSATMGFDGVAQVVARD